MADGKVLHDARRILIFVAMKVVQEQHKPTELDAIDHDLGECVSDELGSFRIEFQREVNLIREMVHSPRLHSLDRAHFVSFIKYLALAITFAALIELPAITNNPIRAFDTYSVMPPKSSLI